jgi:uncharacterized membrane protein
MAAHSLPRPIRSLPVRVARRLVIAVIILGVLFVGAAIACAVANVRVPSIPVSAPAAPAQPAVSTDLTAEDTSDQACWTEPKIGTGFQPERICGYRGQMPSDATDIGPYSF